ncbi:MAG: HD domain-containing protein [Actinomycetota bacterium]|nr:HD domain-containing protein [Actinomycetota bacterium]
MTGAVPVPDDAAVRALHTRYAPSEQVLDLVLTHGHVVADIADWCAGRVEEPVDRTLLRAACLLHDIGTYVLYLEDGSIPSPRSYPLHALVGARLLADEGLPEPLWQAVETHVLMGLSRAEIVGEDGVSAWMLPHRDYLPRTVEAEILCYADRFHSKTPQLNDPQRFAAGLERRAPTQARRFRAAIERFGVPDLEALAAAYGHPVV